MSGVAVDALDAARRLAEAGVPLFLGRPASNKLGFQLPRGWERKAKADPSIVDRWKPGWALCAVTGHLVDVIDIDPRNGGSVEALAEALDGQMPRVYGRASTPSGGEHLLIASLGVRKKQDVVPGVDLQAGNPEGVGRGFIFIAPTVRESKEDGQARAYAWELEPDLGELLLEPDDSGQALREYVARPADLPGAKEYEGPGWEDLEPEQQREATAYVNSHLERWKEKLDDAATWAEGVREEGGRGRGWEGLTYQFAWALAKMAACPWTDFSEEDAEASYRGILPDEMSEACGEKWYDGISIAAASEPADIPPWEKRSGPADDFATVPEAWPAVPAKFNDAYMCAWMAHRGLGGDWCWAAGLGWLRWNGERWVTHSEEVVIEAVRREVLALMGVVAASGDTDALKSVSRLTARSRLAAITALMRGVTHVPASRFDARADYLTCANGAVNLRTGELESHSREHYSTRTTGVDYVPGARHEDWDQVLTALEPEVMSWMQIRFGQAATGHPTSDDILPVGVGSGSNGKSTLLAGLFRAMGDYMTMVPDKLLRVSPGDHPTELMTLKGARLAVIEETPEAGHLDVQRLKLVLGTGRLTARALYRDNVSWAPTHSLFLMTNYLPQVSETDRGTWRRLALVRFSKRFPRQDGFRANIERGHGGRAEAALAWVVEGAQRWYANGSSIPSAPSKVDADTAAWRGETDLLAGFIGEGYVELDFDSSVEAGQFLTAFNRWLTSRGQAQWSSRTLSARMESHPELRGVERRQTRDLDTVSRHPEQVEDLPNRPWVWTGLRWPEELDFG